MLEVWRPRVPASLLLVVLVVLPLPARGQACPRSCNCYQASEVHCTFRSLLNIPPGLPAHTRRINLGFNSISRIQDGSLVNLKKLELLMLHSNDLRLLQDGLFRDLKSLQILKLSYNKLKEISSPQTFSGLSSLLRLYLDHNLLEHLHPRALLQLPSLRLLRLQGNRLHRLHPHALCTLSLLNTYYFSTLRHLDLSNNSLSRVPRATLQTAPLLETLVLQANPWSCDCRMGWLLAWNRAHPDLLKCPSGPQCPLCSSPSDLQGRGLFEQSDLPCSPPIIPSPGKDAPPEEEAGEIQARESLGEPLGSATLGLSDQQGNSIDLSCNITHSSDSREVSPPPDLSLLSSAPIALALSLSLECPVEREGYESLWRILAYYSETALHLEREIMLSKAPALAYRYRQTAETEGYYNTGVKVSIKARPHWLLQPALGIQLNRAQSTASRVSLIVSTLVSAHPDPHTSHPSFAASHPWVLISANASALAAVAGSKVELPCPLLSSGNAKVHWVLPDGSKLISSSSGPDLRVSASGLLLQKAELANAGVYYCVAQAGRDVDVLPVRLAVEESSAPHSGEEVGPPFKVTAGQPVTLSCKASGSPTPELSWLLPDGNIVRRGVALSGGVVMQSNGSLSLPSTSLRDAGHYRCIALNQHGGDSLSTQLEITPRHPPTLRTSFRRGPQSASGRSTKIRAPLLRQVEEGSGGGEEEDERTFVVNRRRQRPLQPPPNRRFPAGKPMRRGQGREGPLRRGGGGGGRPLAAPDQRRNRFDSRHRVTNNKQRIDPKKWADLLAKIRQKTSPTESSRLDTAGETGETGESTAEPRRGGQDKDTARREGEHDAERAETEGSSVDDASLQEEGLHPVYPTATQTQTPEAEPGTDRENQFHSHSQSETIESVTQRETVTSKPVSNEIISEEVEAEERETKPTSSRPRPQRPRQGFYPNLVPESRPQSPWNSRRRIGQGRRIINRQRGRVLTPARPLPDPTNRQSVTPDTSSDQTTTAATAAELSTESRRVDSLASTTSPPSPSVASGSQVPQSHPPTPTPSPHASSPPPDTVTHVDLTTHSANIPGSAVSHTPATARPGISTAQTSAGTTGTRTAPGKHGEEPERGRNVLDAPHSTPSPSPPSDTQPSGGSSITSAAPETNRFSTSAEVAPSASATALSDDTLLTTTQSTPLTTNAITSTTEKTTTALTSTTTTTTTTVFTSTAPPSPTTSASTTTTTPSTTTLTSTTTFSPTTSNPTTTIETTSTPITSTTTTALQTSPAPTTTVTSTSTRATSAERPSVGHAEPRGRPVSGSPNQSRPPTDWKNPGANSIPDSHGSRPQRPPSPPLPAAPGAPVVRSRPRIADPHIRTASFPAESVARLTCEAQGEPKPSITWTKVATGAVMSIHSRAQRFEVLPNGTLVIQNVQLQDRGTYICSAQSFMGRDRLLTTLEVWTRPPRMTLASYREASIHQGGELHLECQASGVPAPLLSWVLPDRSVLTSSSATAAPPATSAAASRITMSANGTLHILATSAGDRGVYRCVASNSAGAASASVRVHVSSLPPVLQQPKEEHLLLSPGRPVYAHCSARGAPPPTLRWRIPDGTLVRPSQFLHGNLFVLPNGTLHIRKVGPKDSGNYECVASNAVGADKRTVRVRLDGSGEAEAGAAASAAAGAAKEEKVSEKPSSSSSLQKDKNKPGDPSEPLASARPPPPSPSDGAGASLRPPPSAPSQPRRPNSANSPPPIDKTDAASPQRPDTIRVPPLSPPPSNTPTNLSLAWPGPLGKTTADSLSPPDKGRAVPPSPVSPFTKAHIVSTSPSISTVSYGGDLHLHCSVTGNPPPIIIWRTPNRKLVDMHFSFDRRLSVRPNGTLTVGAVTEKDVGDYLCIARNKVADDYRLLRVSVVTKPAKIEHKQPPDQMVSLGKPLKVDCLASGLPDPAVRWSLPDGTMVNSVLQGEERGGRTRRLTVFDNGTLLVPAVGMKEQGEYTCYAENQGGQDMMKVNVKIMTTSPPTFTDDRSYHVVKVRQGETAAIPCQARGDPIPAVMWFSPAHRVIPRSSGSGLYSERVVVVPGGSLEVRQAQRIDTGNYTCRAVNSAGQRSMVVGLRVEGPGQSGPAGGGGWSAAINGINGRNGLGGGGGDGWTRNAVPGNGANAAGGAANPALRSETPNGFSRTDAGVATQSGSAISVGADGGRNVGFKVDNSGINRNTPGVPSSSHRLSSSHNAGSAARSSNNEVTAGKPHNDSSAGRENGKISGAAGDVFRGGAPNNWVNAGASRAAVANAGGRPSSGTLMLTTVKQQAAKGQSVLLPCPSHGSPPPRLAWLLPGNGVLPAPYYGSRITVHRNGSLELRGVRPSDSGTLVCVVRGERGETRIQVELQVSDAAQEEAGPPPKSPVSPVSSQSRSVETPQQRAPVTQGPPPRGPSAPRLTSTGPVKEPTVTGPVKEPTVSTHTAALVSIINGETLRLHCPKTPAHPQGPLSWTLPSGKVVPRGESGDSGRYVVQPDGTLVVQRASVFDRGTYSCRSATYDSSAVSVAMVPVIVIAYPPRITKGPSPVTYTRPGVAVELPCLTIATPRATVTWETPDLTQLKVMGQARIYGNRYLSPQGSLVIQNPTIRDTGFYRCTANNVIGADTKATYLHVI